MCRSAQLTIRLAHIFQDAHRGVRRLPVFPFAYFEFLDGGNDLMFLSQTGSSLEI